MSNFQSYLNFSLEFGSETLFPSFSGMQQASINLTQSLHEVYEPDWHGKDEVLTIGKVSLSGTVYRTTPTSENRATVYGEGFHFRGRRANSARKKSTPFWCFPLKVATEESFNCMEELDKIVREIRSMLRR